MLDNSVTTVTASAGVSHLRRDSSTLGAHNQLENKTDPAIKS